MFTTCFNKQELGILTTECIYGFRMIVSANRDYFSKQYLKSGLCNGEVLGFL
jgi:hypothetical protein